MLPSYVLLDLETTGGNPVNDRITEIAAVRFEQGQEVARWSTLVNPGVNVSAFIERLTGISNAMVALGTDLRTKTLSAGNSESDERWPHHDSIVWEQFVISPILERLASGCVLRTRPEVAIDVTRVVSALGQ